MLPAKGPTVSVYRGDTTPFCGVHLKNEDGTDMDVSALTWSAQWRLDSDSDTFLVLTVDSSDAIHGWLHISATSEVTSAMTDAGVWDLQSTVPGSNPPDIVTRVGGKTRLTEDVTRP